MGKAKNVSALMELVQQLSAAEQRALVNKIMSTLADPSSLSVGSRDVLVAELREGRPDCPWCAAKAELGQVVKRGMHKGAQRYFCKACGRYFVSSSNTVFARSRKDADTWRKFINYTIEGKSLAFCAENCDISYQTAFTWRHKVLNAFRVNQAGVQMTERVEMDEMLLPVSYKGNHVVGGFSEKRDKGSGAINKMPRKAYKRGSDNKPRSSKDRACVVCMVEGGNKAFYGAVPGVGFMTEQMLDATLAKHVNKETAMVLVDQYRVTASYLLENGYGFTMLASNTSDNPHEHKPEVQGNLHLQHVNAMHRHIRRFLSGYCGVSTKYLENYISLYVWLRANSNVKQKKRMQKVSVARAAASDCYITGKELRARPAVPQCA